MTTNYAEEHPILARLAVRAYAAAWKRFDDAARRALATGEQLFAVKPSEAIAAILNEHGAEATAAYGHEKALRVVGLTVFEVMRDLDASTTASA